MSKKIQLDHCYNIDKNFAFMKKLHKLGFDLDPQMVEHPGKAFCKFIALRSKNKRERFYLEFVHIGKGGVDEKTPGLSFNYTENLEGFYKKLKLNTKVEFEHKNYEWKKNSIDRLPGWNMLNFKKPPIKNINTWFTEYERSSLKTRKLPKIKTHPNSVDAIHGFKLVLTKKSKENLEKTLSRKLKAKNKLSDDVYLYIEDGKKDRFESIILSCKSLKKAKKYLKNCDDVLFEKKDAIHITNNSRENEFLWDLLIIEK